MMTTEPSKKRYMPNYVVVPLNVLSSIKY